MLDSFSISSSVHVQVGMAVLTVILLTLVVLGWQSWRGRTISRFARTMIIMTQVVLMVQALIGIKLLDQGAGPAQLYIHYIGGLTPLALFLALGWWPSREPRRQIRITAFVVTGSFIVAFLTFTIGQAYVRGRL